MISKEEFVQRCDALIPKEEIEKYNKCRKKMWTTLIITLIVEALILFGLCCLWNIVIYLVPFVVIISILIVVLNLKYNWGDFKKKYHKPVMDILFEGYEYYFQQEKYINENVFKSSCFNANYDRYSGEDFLCVKIPNDDGSASDVLLSLCDLRVTKQETVEYSSRDSNGNRVTRKETRTKIVYGGTFGYVNFPFQFKCDLSINVNHKWHKKIKLEDEKFNKACKVYTDNQLEALVILTPTLMNKIKSFVSRINSFKICLMKNGSMYFGMSRDMFELAKSSRKPTGIVFETFYDDVVDVLAMINEIKDNNKVFKM